MSYKQDYFEAYERIKDITINYNYLKGKLEKLSENYDELKVLYDKVLKDRGELIEVLEEKKKKINRLISAINESNKKIKNLVSKIFSLEVIVGKRHSGWHVGADLGWRINPVTGKYEGYKIPKGFYEGRVENLKFDRSSYMVSFDYPKEEPPRSRLDNPNLSYCIPCDLYTYIGGTAFLEPEELEENKSDDSVHFDSIDDIDRFTVSKGFILNGKVGNMVKGFIFENQGKGFSTGMFYDFCEFKSKETGRLHLRRLLDCGLVSRVSRGLYQFNTK